ncbi:MAG: hypothetical protein RIB67_05655 [Miltoncostaeaceae bacterium]
MTAPGTDREGGFLRGVGALAAATILSNALLFALSLIAARWLVPEEYGVVAAMLAIVLMLSIPGFALQVAMAREIAAVPPGCAGAVVRRRTRQSAVAGAVMGAIALALAPVAGDLLQLPTVWPYALTVVAFAPLMVLSVLRGTMQGRRDYTDLGANLVVEATGRLVCALAALGAGAGATGVTAAPLAGIIVAGVSAVPAVREAWRSDGDLTIPRLPPDILPTLVHFGGFTLLVSADLVIAKAAFTPVVAGEYAAAAFVGKVLLLLPVAVALVLVPEVSARRRRGAPTLGLLGQGQALALAGALPVIIACGVAPGVVAAVTVGPGYEAAESLFLPYSIAAALFAAVNIQALYALTVGAMRVVWTCLAVAIVQVPALALVATGTGGVGPDDERVGLILVMLSASTIALGATARRVVSAGRV